MTATKTSFWKTNVGNTIKTALYIGGSAALGAVISAMANDPDLFGPLTAFINILAVWIKQTYLSPSTPNLGSN